MLTTYLVVPSKEEIEAGPPRDTNDVLQLVSVVHLDDRKNILASINTEDTVLYRAYNAHVNFSLLPFLERLFMEGTRLGKIDYQSIIKYLREHTWIGVPRMKTDLGGHQKTIFWLPLIQPALIDFFLQLEASRASTSYKPSYILCIDSLATKFEGLLRDFCERAAVPTSELKTKGMQAKFINAILEHKVIRQYFSEDDLLLFYYVLTDKGQDIRNNVAHTFYESGKYTFERMALLVFTLLRISQYEAE